jgi:hypothetical protein
MRRLLEFLEVDPNAELDGLKERANVSETRAARRDRAGVGLLKQAPGVELAKQWIPRQTYNTLREVLRPRSVQKPAWDRESLAWAQAQVGEDAETFLRWCGKPTDFWSRSW